MKNLSFVPKISVGIILMFSLAQWSCIEDTEPTDISSRNRIAPTNQCDCEALTPPVRRNGDLPEFE